MPMLMTMQTQMTTMTMTHNGQSMIAWAHYQMSQKTVQTDYFSHTPKIGIN